MCVRLVITAKEKMQIGENAIWGRGWDEDGVSSYRRRLGVGARTPSPSTALMNYVTVFTSSCLSAPPPPPLAWHNLTFLISVHNYILIYVFLRHACLAWSCLLVYGRLLLSRRVRLSPFNWVCRFFFWRGIRQNGVLFTNKLSFVRGRAVYAIEQGRRNFVLFKYFTK